MSENLIRQLKGLKHEVVKPREGWVEKNRSLLLSQIKNTVPRKASIPMSVRLSAVLAIFMPETLVVGTVRFVAIFLIVAIVAPSLYYGTVFASEGALPGEGLYEAKIYTEKIQATVVGLVGDNQTETKLHVEFAKRRANETSKIIRDPSKKKNVASTVAALKIELSTINDKLDQGKDSVPTDVAKDIKANSDQINTVLQDAKNDLIVTATDDNKALADQVKETKDLVQDMGVKAVEVLVDKHLNGDASITKDYLKDAINSVVENSVVSVETSKQNVSGVQTVLERAKNQADDLSISADPNVPTSTTKEISAKISTIIDQTKQVAMQTDAVSQEAAQKADAVKQSLGSDNLAQAMSGLKELSQVTKVAENLSDSAVSQTSPLLPLAKAVQNSVITGSTTSLQMVSTTFNSISSTVFSTTTTSTTATSTTTTTTTTTVKTGTSTTSTP